MFERRRTGTHAGTIGRRLSGLWGLRARQAIGAYTGDVFHVD
jgi:hypothetical protein